MANPLVHFEIQAGDVARAQKFYTDVFGWKIEKWGDMDYWAVYTKEKDTDPGINGGLLPRPAGSPTPEQGANAFVGTVQVDDFDAIAAKIEAAGGTIAMPKYALAGMAWQGYFVDTEGNTFGIHQPDPNAK